MVISLRRLPAAEQLAESPATTTSPLPQDADAVAEHLDVAQDVAREEDRAPALLLLDDEVAHLLASHRIEPAHRLVEDEQLGSCTSAAARPTRWSIPFDSARAGRSIA